MSFIRQRQQARDGGDALDLSLLNNDQVRDAVAGVAAGPGVGDEEQDEWADTVASLVRQLDRFPDDVLRSAFAGGLISTFKTYVDALSADFAGASQDPALVRQLEIAIYFLALAASEAEQISRRADNDAPVAKKGKAKKKTDSDWDWKRQKRELFSQLSDFLNFPLKELWVPADLETVVSIVTKTFYQMLESSDNLKDSALKNSLFDIFSMCVVKYNHAFNAGNSIILMLKSYSEEFLADALADVLEHIMTTHSHNEVVTMVLENISKTEFKEKDTTQAKSFGRFLLRLSDVLPKEVIKSMVTLQTHLDSESYNVRMTMLEVIGNIITHLLETENDDESSLSKNQIDSFFDIFADRFKDVHAHVRSKNLQVLLKLCRERENGKTCIPLLRRKEVVDATVLRLSDKSTNVRRNAIKLFTKLLETHPFKHIYNGFLSRRVFEANRRQVEDAIAKLLPKDLEEIIVGNDIPVPIDDAEKEDGAASENPDASIFDGASKKQQQPSDVNEAQLVGFQLTSKYLADALVFIGQVEQAIPVLCNLLASTTKGEVIEAMDFFLGGKKFGLECAEMGIRKMVHLIWHKAVSEDGKDVKDHLLTCYHDLFLYPDVDPNEDHAAAVESVVQKLIQLTQHWNMAELTSLEQVMCVMTERDQIEQAVIDRFWAILGGRRPVVASSQALSQASTGDVRRDALMYINMFAKARPEIISENIEVLLKVGFGTKATNDLVLARYTCLAFQKLAGSAQVRGAEKTKRVRYPREYPVFSRLCEIICASTSSSSASLSTADSDAWFPFAEQAINTIYALSEGPDVTCGALIKDMARGVFALRDGTDSVLDAFDKSVKIDVDDEEESRMDADGEDAAAAGVSVRELAKLLFIVGHVAIKQIVHLEAVESEWKNRKAEDKKNKGAAKKPTDDLDAVTGTAEDEFTEIVAHVRERELLFGHDSVLAVFGPMISHICAANKTFNDPQLQTQATLALCKLMCVSSAYCEENLQLLLTILEKTTNATIRCNVIIAIGDMAVCFNNLIDQNISYLYNRLSDADLAVKKNALMVLTHLILNGMVKVKGQISEMAKCLEDPEPRISDLARLFFTELASKDNAVYNNLPDIISNLSNVVVKEQVEESSQAMEVDDAAAVVDADATTASAVSQQQPQDAAKSVTYVTGVDETKFRSIMKFLFGFIEKDRQTENIVDKLCQRLKNARTPRQWRDIAYCLSLLPYTSEKSVRRLVEGVAGYADKMHEEGVEKCFDEILAKAKRIPKAETRALIDEFEGLLGTIKNEAQGAAEVSQNAAKMLGKKKRAKGDPVDDATEQMAKMKIKTTESDDEMDVLDMVPKKRQPRAGAAAAKRGAPARRGAKKAVVESDSEDESAGENVESDGAGDDDEDEDDELAMKPAKGKARTYASSRPRRGARGLTEITNQE